MVAILPCEHQESQTINLGICLRCWIITLRKPSPTELGPSGLSLSGAWNSCPSKVMLSYFFLYEFGRPGVTELCPCWPRNKYPGCHRESFFQAQSLLSTSLSPYCLLRRAISTGRSKAFYEFFYSGWKRCFFDSPLFQNLELPKRIGTWEDLATSHIPGRSPEWSFFLNGSSIFSTSSL